MVVTLLILWLTGSVPPALHTICLPSSLAAKLFAYLFVRLLVCSPACLFACLFVRLPAHLLASPLLYSKGKATLAICVLSPMLLCVVCYE